MLVTEVNVYPIKNKKEGSAVQGFARIVLDDELIINGIRVVSGKNGLFLGFPQNYNKDEGKGYDIAFPITAELRTEITNKVIAKYEQAIQHRN
jgi:stage V sporulation protein G